MWKQLLATAAAASVSTENNITGMDTALHQLAGVKQNKHPPSDFDIPEWWY